MAPPPAGCRARGCGRPTVAKVPVNVLEAALARLATDLDELRVPWALVGGFAVSVRSEPRFTRDVDVAVVVEDDAGAEVLVRQLIGRGYTVTGTVDQEYVARLATARLLAPLPGDVVTDLLFASSGIEREIAAGAERLEVIPGLTLPVASLADLVVMKLLARDDSSRPQDAADLVALRRAVTDDDLGDIRHAVALVESRGYARDRDLGAAMEAWYHLGRS